MDGRLIDWRHSLVPACLEGRAPKLPVTFDTSRRRIAESGAVLATNSFLPWARPDRRLELLGVEGLDDLTFDARCPTGVRGTPPHLDLIATGGRNVVAVTAKGPEYLLRKHSVVAAAYDSVEITSNMRPWLELLRELRGRRSDYRFVDVGSVVKLALGLARTFPSHRLHLAYLYWEPSNGASYDSFVHHRIELERLGERVAGSRVHFLFASFAELWASWDVEDARPWLRELVAQLHGRYDVAIEDVPAL